MSAYGLRRLLVVICVVFAVAAVFSGGLHAQANPSEGKGMIELPYKSFRITARAGDGKYKSYMGKDGKCELPTGRYDRFRITLLSEKTEAGIWEMSSAWRYDTLEVRAGETTTLAIGEPFTAHIRPSRYRTSPGGAVDLSLDIIDGDGHVWRAPRPAREARGTRPKFVVADAANETLASHDFEYG